MSELLKLRKANAILFSQWQQAIAEKAEYARLVRELERVLREFRTRMRPVKQMRKARPK